MTPETNQHEAGSGCPTPTCSPLPCPFCGSDAELETCEVERGGDIGNGTNVSVPWSTSQTWHTVKCSSCDCMLDNGYRDEAAAIAEWNQRDLFKALSGLCQGWRRRAESCDASAKDAFLWAADDLASILKENDQTHPSA